MSRLRVHVSTQGRTVLDIDADDCTLAVVDTQSDTIPVSMWGDDSGGVWVYLPGDDEPYQIVPIG